MGKVFIVAQLSISSKPERNLRKVKILEKVPLVSVLVREVPAAWKLKYIRKTAYRSKLFISMI
jgi:hypothetical protein